jgi:hypothetical protein
MRTCTHVLIKQNLDTEMEIAVSVQSWVRCRRLRMGHATGLWVAVKFAVWLTSSSLSSCNHCRRVRGSPTTPTASIQWRVLGPLCSRLLPTTSAGSTTSCFPAQETSMTPAPRAPPPDYILRPRVRPYVPGYAVETNPSTSRAPIMARWRHLYDGAPPVPSTRMGPPLTLYT